MCAVLTDFKDNILLEIRCQTSEKDAFPSNIFPLSTIQKLRLNAVQVIGRPLLRDHDLHATCAYIFYFKLHFLHGFPQTELFHIISS